MVDLYQTKKQLNIFHQCFSTSKLLVKYSLLDKKFNFKELFQWFSLEDVQKLEKCRNFSNSIRAFYKSPIIKNCTLKTSQG